MQASIATMLQGLVQARGEGKMKIAVLSGKGGAGKTFVSVNLSALNDQGVYMDCDVEEPNGYVFYQGQAKVRKPVHVRLPDYHKETCLHCNKCVDFCQFNALAAINDDILIFDEICHSCGGCSLVCPTNAMTERDKEVGSIYESTSQDLRILWGEMNVGEASGIPIIESLMDQVDDQEDTVIDCPPGSACITMESIKEADYCVLVAEPTIFSQHNVAMVIELVEKMNKPWGLVINKEDIKDNPIRKMIAQEGYTLLGAIPFEKDLSRILAEGGVAVKEKDTYRGYFKTIEKNIKEATHGTMART